MHKLKPCQSSIQNAITVLENEKQCVLRQIQMGGCDRDCIKCDLVMKDSEILEGYDTAIAVLRRAQPANEPLIDVCAMLEQAAQDMDDKCRQWQCVLQRVHDAGTFDQNSGLWVGVDKEREAKAQASFEAYRYALGVIDKIAEHVSNPYKFAHKPGGEQDG